MTFKQAIALEKRQMPDYMRRFFLGGVIGYFGGHLLCAVVAAIIAAILESRGYAHPELPVLIWLPLLIPSSILLVRASTKARRRLAADEAARLDAFYAPVPQEECEKELREAGLLADDGFFYIIEQENGEERTAKIHFENAAFFLAVRYQFYRVELGAVLVDPTRQEILWACDMTPALYSYLRQKKSPFLNAPTVALFERDKPTFCRLAIRYQNQQDPNLNTIDRHVK